MSVNAPFSKGLIVRESWELTKKNLGAAWKALGLFLLILVPAMAIQAAFQEGENLLHPSQPTLAIVLGLIGALCSLGVSCLNLVLEMGIYRIFLNLSRGLPTRASLLFSETRKFWRALGGSFLYVIIVGVGFILLIVPGIIFWVRLSQFFYVIIDENLGPVDALKRSWELTRGSAWNLFLLYLIVWAIMMAGVIALGIGLLWAVPLVCLIGAKTYDTLRLRQEAATSETLPAPEA